jgi:hypothetical protein
MMFSRPRVTGAALSLVLTAGVASPVIARAASAPAPSAVCAALATQLFSDVATLQNGLTTVPPDPSAALGVVGQLLGTTSALQSSSCLPVLPPATGVTPSACVPDVASLLSDLFGVIGALAKPTPDLSGALTHVTDLLTDVAQLTTDVCLPLPVPGVPLPTPSIPDLPVPVPVPVPTLSTPTLPAPAASASATPSASAAG